MFYGYNDGYMGLAWYEEDLDRAYLEQFMEVDNENSELERGNENKTPLCNPKYAD